MSWKKIYIVTRGEYSDYGIEAVFSSRKRAEKFIEEYKKRSIYYSDPCEIEVWPLNGWKEGSTYYFVRMYEDGKVDYSREVFPVRFDGFETWVRPWKKTTKKGDAIRWDTVPILESTVEARDQKHAIKIVNEKRLQLIAQGKFKYEGQK